MKNEYSRPLALAAALADADSGVIEHLFSKRRLLIRLEESRAREALDEALLLAVNETLRFCPNVTVALAPVEDALVDAIGTIATEIHGDAHGLAVVPMADANPDVYDAVLNIGPRIGSHPAWVAIDATGWCSRVATSAGGGTALPRVIARPNVYASLAAACLGVGQLFLALVGRPLAGQPLELSLYDLTTGAPGTLAHGPELLPLALEALLVGCGGVANGFAYATARAPVTGRLEAVDKQSLGPENMGAYICATLSRVGTAKAEIIRDALAPSVDVVPRAERFLFFCARLGYGRTVVPEIVVVGLDDERVRHDVQRLWAETTFDLAAEGLTAQLIVKNINDGGVCLLGAYRVRPDAPDELDELAAALGLPRERVVDFESEISEADIAAAPTERRAALEVARRSGQRVCGSATALDLGDEEHAGAFTPAVPFVTAFSGIVGAAQTARLLCGGGRGSLHFQFSFLSYRGRTMRMRCSPTCECQGRRRAAPRRERAGARRRRC